jgi:hypothetical protein
MGREQQRWSVEVSRCCVDFLQTPHVFLQPPLVTPGDTGRERPLAFAAAVDGLSLSRCLQELREEEIAKKHVGFGENQHKHLLTSTLQSCMQQVCPWQIINVYNATSESDNH